MSTNTSLIVLISLLATSVNLQALVKGCLTWDTGRGTCNTCYRRQVSTKGCGPLLPVTDTCLIHSEQIGQKTRCTACRQGYKLTPQRQCAPFDVFNCVYSRNFANGKYQCLACGNGQYPTAGGTLCAPLAKGAIPNCLWGLAINTVVNCLRCNPGYVVGGRSKSCVPITAATTGCSTLGQDGTCGTCNVQAGYSMQKNGKCKFIKKE